MGLIPPASLFQDMQVNKPDQSICLEMDCVV